MCPFWISVRRRLRLVFSTFTIGFVVLVLVVVDGDVVSPALAGMDPLGIVVHPVCVVLVPPLG